MSRKQTPKIKTEWLTIYPSLSHDTCAGKPIKEGVAFMQLQIGTCNTKHHGKPVEITIGSANTLVLSSDQRQCSLNLERFIEEALKMGLCAETLDFEKPRKPK